MIESIDDNKFEVYATAEIVSEYKEIISEMINRKQGNLDHSILDYFISKLNFVDKKSNVKVCRDPDDDKFINCALDSKALFIVSGDKDLLTLGKYDDIEIITAAKFCEKYLK